MNTLKTHKKKLIVEIFQFLTFPEIARATKCCRLSYMLLDSNRGLMLTDDNLNVT